MRFIWVVTLIGLFNSYVPTAISAEPNVPRVPSPIHEFPITGFDNQPTASDPLNPRKLTMQPTPIGVCPDFKTDRKRGPTGNDNPRTRCESGFIPLEKLIQDPLDAYANWLAQDRAAQTRVVTDNIEVHSKLLDSLRARIQQLEQRIQALEKQ